MKVLNKIFLTIALSLGLLNLNLNSQIGHGQLLNMGITANDVETAGFMVTNDNRVQWHTGGHTRISDIVEQILTIKIESLQIKIEKFQNLLFDIQTLNDLYNNLSEEYVIIEKLLNAINKIIGNSTFTLNNAITTNYYDTVSLWQSIVIEIDEIENNLNRINEPAALIIQDIDNEDLDYIDNQEDNFNRAIIEDIKPGLFKRLAHGLRNVSAFSIIPSALISFYTTSPILGIGAGMIQTVAGSVTIAGTIYLIVYSAVDGIYRLIRK